MRCVYCDECTPGDLYCGIVGRCLTEHEANAQRKCASFRFNPMNAITLETYHEPAPRPEPVETLSLFEEDR